MASIEDKPSIEDVQEFWDRQPCNIKQSNLDKNSKKYYQEVENKRYFVEPHIPTFAEFLKYIDKNILEIGCGIGTDSLSFAKNGANITCIDLSKKSLEICEKGFKQYNLNAEFIHCNAEEISDLKNLVNKKYDLVYSFGVIHHSPNPEKIIENIYKVLKPGGELKIMLYATNSWKKIMIDSGYDQYEAQNGCPIAKTYTNDEVKELLFQFSNINIIQTHIFKFKIKEYKKNIFIYEDWFLNMPPKMLDSLNNKLGWHLCIKAIKQLSN